MKRPLVSVVLPTYNRAWCIEKAVRSVLSQTLTDFELVIVDNNSNDDTLEIIGRIDDSRVRTLQIDNGGVIAKWRNIGIENAGGKYVAFLDSDDLWKAEKLQICVSRLESGMDICYHQMSEIGNKKAITFIRSLGRPVLNDLLANGNAIATSSVVVSRELLMEIGMFSEDESLVAIEDYDAWVRLSKVTNRFDYVECVLGEYMIGADGLLGGSDSRKRRRMALEGIRKEHSELHQSILGYTPGWLVNALARHYVRISLKTATRLNASCLLSRASLAYKAKAVALQGLAILQYAKTRASGAYQSILGVRVK